MNDLRTLLARCQELGATLTPGPENKLKIQAPAPLPEELREALRQRKAEVLVWLAQTQTPLWPCPACSGQVRLEPVDEYAPSRFWTCSGCGTWGATHKGATYPTVWVSPRTMQ
jgi:hypothetical protein